MAKRKAAKKKVARGRKAAKAGRKMRAGKKAAKKKVAGRRKAAKAGRKMRAGKKAAKSKVAARRKAAKGGRRLRAGKKAAPQERRKRAGHHRVQPRVWRRTARLAQDGIAALDEGNLDEVRECLQAVHAVAHCADER